MTKTDLLEKVATVIEVSRKDASALLETILGGMVRSFETPRREHGWRFPRNGLHISGRATN